MSIYLGEIIFLGNTILSVFFLSVMDLYRSTVFFCEMHLPIMYLVKIEKTKPIWILYDYLTKICCIRSAVHSCPEEFTSVYSSILLLENNPFEEFVGEVCKIDCDKNFSPLLSSTDSACLPSNRVRNYFLPQVLSHRPRRYII